MNIRVNLIAIIAAVLLTYLMGVQQGERNDRALTKVECQNIGR